MTIEHAYNDYVEKLKSIYEDRESSNIAGWVFESITGLKRTDRINNKHKELDSLHSGKLASALEELLQHKPVQYVLGESWWYKMKLFVNENVLIPRPETEELVTWVIDFYAHSKNEELHIVDIGTGSGCIAIALKKELPGAKVAAIDTSADALLVTRKNAEEQNAEIQLVHLDFLDENTWFNLPSFDVIVSNPPYIPEEEAIKLDKNVVKFEPQIALFVPTSDPFVFYKKIASFAQRHLNEEGKIFVEVHEGFAEDVKNIFLTRSFRSIVKKDLFGRDRMICAYV